MTRPDPTPVVELDPDVYARHQAEQDAAAAAEFDDFDAFWSAVNAARPARIRGVLVTPPHDMPLSLIGRLDGVLGSADEAAIKQVVGDIFGADVLDRWTAAGMGLREFQTVLAWAGAHMRGQPCDFAAALELVAAALAAAEEAEGGGGKAGNRAERRRKGKRGRGPSAGTGG